MAEPYKNKFKTEHIRLQSWDYTNPWWYFVTINTKNHQEIFGIIKNGKMNLNDVGKIASKHWSEIPEHYTSVELDYFVIMPNHLHGIIILNNVETGHAPSLQSLNTSIPSLGNIIGSFKSAVTKWCNANNHKYFAWQPRFFERIIRNEKELNNIRKYIEQNPLKWEIEKNNPDNIDYDLLYTLPHRFYRFNNSCLITCWCKIKFLLEFGTIKQIIIFILI